MCGLTLKFNQYYFSYFKKIFLYQILLILLSLTPINAMTIDISTGQTAVQSNITDDDGTPGSIIKDGLGDLITQTRITYSGTTSVLAGRLFAMGSLGATSQTISVASGATLGGTGPISGIVTNNGTLSPSGGGINTQGVSIPVGTTMTIIGSVDQSGGGTTRLYFNPTASDKINVSGGITAGSVYVTPVPGYYQNSTTYSNVTTGTTPAIAFNNPDNLDISTTLDPGGKSFTATGGGNVTVPAGSTNIRTSTFTASVSGNSITLPKVTGLITLTNSPTLTASADATIGTKIIIDSTTGNNPTISPAAGTAVNFSGEIASSNSVNAINLSGADKTSIVSFNGNSTGFNGSVNATNVNLNLNGNFSNATANINSGSLLTGVGTIGTLNHISGSIRPGNLSDKLKVEGNYTATSGGVAKLYTEIGPSGESGGLNVTGNITLSNDYTVYVIMTEGHYPVQITDYNISSAGGTIIGDTSLVTVKWIGHSGLTFNVGKSADGKYLILKSTVTNAFSISDDQTQSDVDAATLTSKVGDAVEIINIGDVVAADSGLTVPTVPAAPVAAQPDLTLIFQSNSSEITSAATSDAFRFKGFSSGSTPSVSGKKNTMEALLTALSKNGPVSYERNETRLWVTPFVNRSRTNRTSSDLGNQGWSGGSLIGLEQRDKKNIWSLGLLTGLMGSRSHVLGAPDTFSKTNGFLLGAFNTYKYTKSWGHEVLISRTNTFIDSQRYGLDSTDKTTPFYAISNYKSTTDVGNAQLNYLFNIIKKKITCRLNTGITYVGSQSGKITERNAGINGLTTDASKNASTELYSGVGIRRIWEVDKITIRTTAVYEYGYQMTSTGSATRTTTQSVAPTTFTTPPGPRQNKHYLQLNSSYLDRNTGLKFILSYSGALYKNVNNHTGMAKVEYRF